VKYYYEAKENVLDEFATSDFIRIDITDMTELERTAVLNEIKSIMSGKDYRLVYHECGHENRLRCSMEEL